MKERLRVPVKIVSFLSEACEVWIAPHMYRAENQRVMCLQAERQDALREAREMFYFGYENYMSYAFPADELDPIHCTGRGHDHGNPYVEVLLCYGFHLVTWAFNFAVIISTSTTCWVITH